MQILKYLIGLLTLLTIYIWLVVFQLPDQNLHVIACDVGQGDAILFIYKNTQVLTDGGPDEKVINCLSKYMPFWDREIELVVSTHPDADHSTGLTSVIERYKVDNIFINPIDSGTQTIKALENMVGGHGVKIISPVEGNGYRLGLIYLDILNPSRLQIESLNEKVEGSPLKFYKQSLSFYKPIDPTNEYSISYKLSFGNFTGIFTGDFQNEVSDRLAEIPGIGPVNYIKVPHHGSKNGITENLIKALMPKVAVISVGKKNPYHHPSQEILDMLNKYNIKTVRTDEMGAVEIVSDGEKYWLKN